MKRKFSMLLGLMVFLSVLLCCAPSWGLSLTTVYSISWQGGSSYDCPSGGVGKSTVWFSIGSVGMVAGDTFTLSGWPGGPYTYITYSERDDQGGPVTAAPDSCCIAVSDAIGDKYVSTGVTITITHGASPPPWEDLNIVYSLSYQGGNSYDCPSTVSGKSSVWFSVPSVGMVAGDTFTLSGLPAGPYTFIAGSERDSTAGPATGLPNSCCVSVSDAIGSHLNYGVLLTIIPGASAPSNASILWN